MRLNKKQQTIKTYNESAEALAERYDEIGPRIDDIEETFALVRIKNPKVLEIGYGSGRDAEEILKRTRIYMGIDISEGMYKVAQQRIPKGKFMLADVESFVFPKEADVIFAFASLIHTERAKLSRVFDAMYEALVPGGLVRASLKFYPKYKEVTKHDRFGSRTYYLYSAEDIRAFPAEFNILKCQLNKAEGQDWLEILLQKPHK